MSPAVTATADAGLLHRSRDRRDWIALGLILLVALAVRLVLVVGQGNRILFADTSEYVRAAQSLISGHGPGAEVPRSPVYPAFMALGFLLFGNGNLIAVRLLQLPVGLAIVAMCWSLAARVGRPEHGVLTALIATASPTLAFTTGLLYPTAIYTALILGIALTALALDRRPRIGLGALLGALAALVFMTDAVAAAPIAAVLAWLAWGIRRRGPRLALALATGLAVSALVMVPVFRYYDVAYKHPPVFMEKAQLMMWFSRTGPPLKVPGAVVDTSSHFRALGTREFVAREWRLLRGQPVPYLRHFGWEFLHFFWPMPDRVATRNFYTAPLFRLIAGACFAPVLLLSIAGLLGGAALLRNRLLLALLVLATAALYSLFYTQMRYRTPVEPYLMILAALGATRLLPRLSNAVIGIVLRTASAWPGAASAASGAPSRLKDPGPLPAPAAAKPANEA